MRSDIRIIQGIKSIKESVEYVINKVNYAKTLVIVTDLSRVRQYDDFNRNVQVGLSYKDLTIDMFKKYRYIIVEPYDVTDLRAFMDNTKLIEGFLKTKGHRLYIPFEGELWLYSKKHVDIKNDWKVINSKKGVIRVKESILFEK